MHLGKERRIIIAFLYVLQIYMTTHAIMMRGEIPQAAAEFNDLMFLRLTLLSRYMTI